MGKYYEQLPEELITWIKQQECFWVATAPLSPDGHVNVSPKGMQDGKIFHVVDERACYYLDLTGSGNETISHLYEHNNARLTIMFSAFHGAPRIVRLFGRGRVIERGTRDFDRLFPPLQDGKDEHIAVQKASPADDAEDWIDAHPVTDTSDARIPSGTRAAIWIDIEQVSTSCGFSVPYYDFKGYRYVLEHWADQRIKSEKAGRIEDGMERYWAFKNQRSVDGMPGTRRGVRNAKRMRVEPMEKFVGGRGEAYLRKGRWPEVKSWLLVLLGVVMGVWMTLVLREPVAGFVHWVNFYGSPEIVEHACF